VAAFARLGMTTKLEASLSPCPLVADGQEFYRPVRDDDPEGRPDRALDQVDLAVMGAHELGGDRKSEPTAAGAARGLERLEQMLARLLRHAGPGVGDLQDRDRAFAPAGDANLHAGGIVLRVAFQRLRCVAYEV